MSRLVKFAIAAAGGFLFSFSQPWSLPIIEPYSGFVIDSPLQGILAYFALVPLFVVLYRSKSALETFFLAFFAGFVYFYSCFYWVNVAVTVFGGVPLYFSVVIVAILVIYCAMQWGFYLAFGKYASEKFNLNFLLFVPLFWGAAEYSRNYLFTGYPWNQAGYTQARIAPVLQFASLLGVYGLSVLVVGVNAAFALLWLYFKKEYRNKKVVIAYCASFFGVLLFAFVFGFYKISANEQAAKAAPKIRAAVLQGNILQDIKNHPEVNGEYILNRYKELFAETNKDEVDLTVLPEGSHPYAVDSKSAEITRYVWMEFPHAGHTVMGGESVFKDSRPERTLGNSAFLIGKKGEILDRHDKTHLVPFGEYVPYYETLKKFGIKKIVSAVGNFTPGKRGKLLRFQTENGSKPEARLGVTICYEGIFPEISRYFANNGANLFVNITNDAWYGVSSAPYQHLYMYSMRSVENGRATVRAANAGVSAYIDSSGAVVSQTGLFEKTAAYYEAPLLSGKTVYMTVGDVAGYVPLLGTLALFFAALGASLYKRVKAKGAPSGETAGGGEPRENFGAKKKGKTAKNGKR